MKLTEDQISALLPVIGEWRREGDWLIRDFKFENFQGALDFVNLVGAEAEAMDHHPDILLHGWNQVKLSVMTHRERGLTKKDFELAGKINEIGDGRSEMGDRRWEIGDGRWELGIDVEEA